VQEIERIVAKSQAKCRESIIKDPSKDNQSLWATA
jgi:hypothetical protein